MKRPKSITIIAWLIIIIAVLSLFSLVLTYHKYAAVLSREYVQLTAINQAFPVSPILIYSISGLIAVANAICGIALLRAQNWARYAYLLVGVIATLFGFYVNTKLGQSLWALLPSLVLFIVFLYFLFRARTAAYFQPKQDNHVSAG